MGFSLYSTQLQKMSILNVFVKVWDLWNSSELFLISYFLLKFKFLVFQNIFIYISSDIYAKKILIVLISFQFGNLFAKY